MGDHSRVHAQIVLYDGFDPFDVIAPFEVLAAGAEMVAGDLAVTLVAAEGPRAVISGTRGLALAATAAIDPADRGWVIVPGASGPTVGDPDDGVDTIPVVLARAAQTALTPLLHKAAANPEVILAGVCGGSIIMAMSGLIEGRHAVTHHLGLELLEAAGVHPVAARVVDDGDLITAGGVTSGLDLALHLLDRGYGPRVAHAVEQLFEYERRGTVWRPVGREPWRFRVSIQGDWDVTIKTPIGTLAVLYAFTELRGGLTGTATYRDETVALQDFTSESTEGGTRLRWRQAVTKPMRLNLAFDVLVTGDVLSGHSRAGRLPKSAVSGARR